MKSLKFKSYLVQQILSGEKTSTWRLFDDKDLQIGDELKFINSETLEEFGTAQITDMKVRTLSTLSEDDFSGHERYASEEEMINNFKNHYGDKVNKDSEVKIITFSFKK